MLFLITCPPKHEYRKQLVTYITVVDAGTPNQAREKANDMVGKMREHYARPNIRPLELGRTYTA